MRNPIAYKTVYAQTDQIFRGSYQWELIELQSNPAQACPGDAVFQRVTSGDFAFNRYAQCPLGFRLNPYPAPSEPPCIKSLVASCPDRFGDPITLDREIVEQETDYALIGTPLRLDRFYNSLGRVARQASDPVAESRWKWRFQQSVIAQGDTAVAFRPDGRRWYFKQQNNAWRALFPTNAELAQTPAGWQLLTGANEIEAFDPSGRLLRVARADGRDVKLAYSTDDPRRIESASDSFGRVLTFDYQTRSPLEGLTTLRAVGLPDGNRVQYDLDPVFQELASVTRADGTTRRYTYAMPDDIRRGLQTIVDETGQTLATFELESLLAKSTVQAGGANRYTFTDYRSGSGAGNVIVTDPRGNNVTYHYALIGGMLRRVGQDQPAGSGCAAASSSLTYDANGNVAARTDFRGIVTAYTYDLARNLETGRVEGSGTPEARTISTRWHPFWRLMAARAEPGQRTTWVYNGQPDPVSGSPVACAPPDAQVIDGVPIAVVCRRIEQATTDPTGAAGFTASADGLARVWRYTYDRHGNILSEDGPREDVADVATYEYWPADATCPGAGEGPGMDKGCRGQLKRATDPAGHVTEYLKYDAHGQLLHRRDPNGAESRYSYDARQRLTARTEAGLTTAYQRDPRGLLTQIRLPDGAVLSYEYDAAHRLVGVQDSLGNRARYTLDPAGNRVKETLTDPGGALARHIAREYDALSRVQRETWGATP